MIDYLLTFTDEATAKADPVVGQYFIQPQGSTPGFWRGDLVIAGVQLWQPANDVTTPVPGGGNLVIHTFLAGFWLTIATLARVAALDSHAATQLVTNREAPNATGIVLQSVWTLAQRLALDCQPVYTGSRSGYPFNTSFS